MIERKIVIGLIIDTEFCKEIIPIYKPQYLQSNTARTVAGWCIDYFKKYNECPGKNIETIFYEKLNGGLDKDLAEEIEEDIFPGLSDEAEEDPTDSFLFDEAIKHFKETQYKNYAEQLLDTVEDNRLDKSAKLNKLQGVVSEFAPVNVEEDTSLSLNDKKALQAIKNAFEQVAKPVIVFPNELGEFWNDQLVEGGLVGILAREKIGKSWMLLELAMKSARQGKNVAFFQAGDMSEAAQLIRIGIYLNKCSNKDKYCSQHLEPCKDCIKNQSNSCTKQERECSFGIGKNYDEIRGLNISDYKEMFNEYPDYVPCHNCSEWCNEKLGVPWFKQIDAKQPIGAKQAMKAVSKFFKTYKGQFRLSTHANGTLSVNKIEKELELWENKYGFFPDVIIIDYADLLICDERVEFRHQQNAIWKGLRRLSQTIRGGKEPLVISPTQADMKSYQQTSINLTNFSEDKRKFSHATAFYALNQDAKGREKSLGLVRIGELLLRDGEFNPANQITILQNLRRGRPYIGAFWGGENKIVDNVTED